MTVSEIRTAKHEAFCDHEDACRAAFEAAVRGDKVASAAKAKEVRKHADEMMRLQGMLDAA